MLLALAIAIAPNSNKLTYLYVRSIDKKTCQNTTNPSNIAMSYLSYKWHMEYKSMIESKSLFSSEKLPCDFCFKLRNFEMQ